jgi:hypothetical protein
MCACPTPCHAPHHVHLQVRVTEIIANTYYARVHVSRGGDPPHEVDVDARPSDAINLAVRFGAPVYISKKIAGMRGRLVCLAVDHCAKAHLDCAQLLAVAAAGKRQSILKCVARQPRQECMPGLLAGIFGTK